MLGSIVGGSASIATAWVTQRTLGRHQAMDAEIKKREALYSEFIAECSKLIVDALDHSLDQPDKVLHLYALENRIRLCASDAVVAATEQKIDWIGKQYAERNLAPDELRERVLAAFHDSTKRDDPLKRFSEACRRDLASLRTAI